MVLNSNIDYYTLRLIVCGSVGWLGGSGCLLCDPDDAGVPSAHRGSQMEQHTCIIPTLLGQEVEAGQSQALTGRLCGVQSATETRETLPTSIGEEKQPASPFPTTHRESIKETIIKKYRIIKCGNFHGGKKEFN